MSGLPVCVLQLQKMHKTDDPAKGERPGGEASAAKRLEPHGAQHAHRAQKRLDREAGATGGASPRANIQATGGK